MMKNVLTSILAILFVLAILSGFFASFFYIDNAGKAPGQHKSLAVEDGGAERVFHLVACGDILLSRTPARRARDYGFRYLFEGVKELVGGSDLSFANLESPMSYRGQPWPGKPENVTFRGDPAYLMGILWSGIDIVSLANNHMNDYGPRALTDTMDYLDLLGVRHVGAGRDYLEAHEPAILYRDGKSFAFLAYADPIWSTWGAGLDPAGHVFTRVEARTHGMPAWKQYDARSDSSRDALAGVAHTGIHNMRCDIASLKKKHNPDYIFVSVHWGEEHYHYPVESQKVFGRAAIDAGAAAVLGHHPHVLQGVEAYKDGLIIYSMGNFIFDMQADSTYRTAVFHLFLKDGRVEQLKIEPVSIERYVYAPSRALGEQARSIRDDLIRWSGPLDTRLRDDGYYLVLDL